MHSEEHNESLSLAERKQMLIAEGAAHRMGITYGRTAVRTSLSAESLAKSAIAHVAMGAMSAFKGGSMLKGANLGNLQILLPIAMSVIARLSKKTHLVKPVARGALVLGVVAAIARFVIRRKKANKAKKRGF
jgi:predicted 2-oxoglutarate/Fe(II)-dependent dioxygenase YbiX